MMAKKYQIRDGRYFLSLGDKFLFFSAYCLWTSAIKFFTRFRRPGSTGVSANCRSDKPGRIRLVNLCTDKFILPHFLVGKLPVSAADVNSAGSVSNALIQTGSYSCTILSGST